MCLLAAALAKIVCVVLKQEILRRPAFDPEHLYSSTAPSSPLLDCGSSAHSPERSISPVIGHSSPLNQSHCSSALANAESPASHHGVNLGDFGQTSLQSIGKKYAIGCTCAKLARNFARNVRYHVSINQQLIRLPGTCILSAFWHRKCNDFEIEPLPR